MSIRFRKLVSPAGGLAALLIAGAAFAYVLPSVSILRRMVERRDDLNLSAVEVRGTATFFAPYAQEAGTALSCPGDREIQADAVIDLKLPGRCRFEVSVPEGAKSASVNSFGKKRAEGTQIAAVNQALSQVCPLLALRSSSEGEAREAVTKHLRSLKIDTKETGLARFDGKIVYVIGSRAENAPQFWIYKDTFQPARVFYSEGGTRWDVRLRNFGSPVTGDAFPRLVEVARGDEQLLRFTALQSNAKAQLSDSLF
jgi:hypothetical protein